MEEIETTNDGCVRKKKLLFFLRIFEVMVPDIYLELGKYCRLVQMKHSKFTTKKTISKNERNNLNTVVRKAGDNKDMSEDRSANKTEMEKLSIPMSLGLERLTLTDTGYLADDEGDEDENEDETSKETEDETESLDEIESLLESIDVSTITNNSPKNRDENKNEVATIVKADEISCSSDSDEEDDECFNNDDSDIDSRVGLHWFENLPPLDIEKVKKIFAGTGFKIGEVPVSEECAEDQCPDYIPVTEDDDLGGNFDDKATVSLSTPINKDHTIYADHNVNNPVLESDFSSNPSCDNNHASTNKTEPIKSEIEDNDTSSTISSMLVSPMKTNTARTCSANADDDNSKNIITTKDNQVFSPNALDFRALDFSSVKHQMNENDLAFLASVIPKRDYFSMLNILFFFLSDPQRRFPPNVNCISSEASQQHSTAVKREIVEDMSAEVCKN